MSMLKNHDVWSLMGVDGQVTLSILHIPTVVSNRSGDTVIRGFSGTSLGTKLEVDIITDSLLDNATMADLVKIDSPNSVLLPSEINRHTESVK